MRLSWLYGDIDTTSTYESQERNDVELVMYGRRFGCMDQLRATAWLQEHDVPYRFVDIGDDDKAAFHLERWVGYRSVPTFVVAASGEKTPIDRPEPLNGRRPRGVNRGTLITEPTPEQLAEFLLQHDLLAESGT